MHINNEKGLKMWIQNYLKIIKLLQLALRSTLLSYGIRSLKK